ncbi:MAG TPA: RraA family protein [Bryobacteraceae bacterium]|jgi:3-hexulose-6-phosphate synthase / 6-phospho-3-hexuloisomerase|nr:RraA family protein [Bryobacteraceae bacterium]
MNFAAATWSDALDQLGIRGVLDGLTLRSGAGPILGPALTVKETAGEFPLEDFRIADILEAITPGAVLVFDAGGAPVSTFGGLAAVAALRKGVSGVIIDGACRDLAEIQDSGLWLASRHVTPLSGKGRIKTEAIGVAVNAGGITVNLGDFIAGDETGIVCIPGDRLEQVAGRTRDLTSRDENFRDLLRAGDSFRAAADRLKHL